MQRRSWSSAALTAAALMLSLLLTSDAACAAPADAAVEAPEAAAAGVITCSAFASALRHGTNPFRSLAQTSSAVFTAANQQGIRYLAVKPSPGAGATYPTIVFFEGSAQVMPDWPAAMLVSASGALCNHAGLVFFDYPGVGGTTYPGNSAFTYDQVSEAVYGLLTALNSSGALKVARIDPAGWSLGTEAALKFAILAARNRGFKASGMSIGNLFLIAPNTGGDLQSAAAVTPLPCGSVLGQAVDAAVVVDAAAAPAAGRAVSTFYPATGSQAMCATSILDQLLVQATYDVGEEIGDVFSRLLFPVVDLTPGASPQGPYGPGSPPSICAATVSGATVQALCNLAAAQPIETQCAANPSSTCAATLTLLAANREEAPYFPGLSYEEFYGQRSMIFHFAYASCTGAATTAWQSTGCEINPNQTASPHYDPAMVVDGSPCLTVQTVSANAAPTIQGCPGLESVPLKGAKFYVWTGQEDLITRHDYGQALCTWLSSNGYSCTYHSTANAGHGVLYNAAGTIYSQLVAALAASPATPNGTE
jgi:pimeloyl-ACP methyl ester carboxylesterase